jgi:hypothetical protein
MLFLFAMLALGLKFYLIMYFIIRNPPKRRMKKRMAKRLKYLSMKLLMLGPNFRNKPATKKKRRERLTVEATRKRKILSLKTPEAMVKTLYGMGLKPARNTYQKPYWL